jgi:hypothetical protein
VVKWAGLKMSFFRRKDFSSGEILWLSAFVGSNPTPRILFITEI